MRRPQHHLRRTPSRQRLRPSRRTQTPSIPSLKPGKPELRHRRAQIVPARRTERQKRLGHHRTNGMAPRILRPRLATPGPRPPRLRRQRTRLQLPAQNVARKTPTSAIERHRAPLSARPDPPGPMPGSRDHAPDIGLRRPKQGPRHSPVPPAPLRLQGRDLHHPPDHRSAAGSPMACAPSRHPAAAAATIANASRNPSSSPFSKSSPSTAIVLVTCAKHSTARSRARANA